MKIYICLKFNYFSLNYNNFKYPVLFWTPCTCTSSYEYYSNEYLYIVNNTALRNSLHIYVRQCCRV